MASETIVKGQNLRAEGNALYSQVSRGRFDLPVKRGKLVRAHELYDEALKISSSSEERSSCCKNLGALNFLWSQVELESAPSWEPTARDTLDKCRDHIRRSVSFFLKAKLEGIRAGKPREWLDHVDASLLNAVNWAMRQSRILALSDAPMLRDICDEFDGPLRNGNVKSEAAVVANLELARYLFDQVKLRNSDAQHSGRSHQNSPRLLVGGCKQPLQRAVELLGTLQNQPLRQKIADLEAELENFENPLFQIFNMCQK